MLFSALSEDPSWLGRFHAGERAVLEECYREHFSRALTAAARVLSSVDAETVTHEVFFRLLSDEKTRRGFGGGNLGAWVAQISANAAIDHHRRRRREVGEEHAGDAPDVDGARFDDEVEAKMLVERFCRERLPSKWKSVFETRFLRQLPQREAALELGIQRSTLAYQEQQAGAEGAPLQKATFALIVGSNQSVDANLPPLKYADDDAARYLDLFRLLGARTYLLSRLDDNTRSLHPQAAAEADEPRRTPFYHAVAELAQDVAQASARGVETVVYLVYAGHGNVTNGQGYITLEDARITGAELAQIVARIPATRVHVIVDACASYFLAYSRGPGGERRALPGFHASALTEDSRVGVLLSTSSARESHEWDAFQGGVFSHEVRSGLYGAADADGNGEVSYKEIAAFVARANAAVPNERYRPDVYARAPRAPGASDTLLDIRGGLRRRLVIDGKQAGHYYLEDARGVRVADVHNGPGQTLSLVRPGPTIPLYLRSADDEREFPLDPAGEVLALADLSPSEPRTRTRGAAHDSFSLVFSLPFDAAVVADYRDPPPPPPEPPPSDADADARSVSNARLRRTLGLVALGVGAVGVGAGTSFSLSARSASRGSSPGESQADAVARNDRIAGLNTAGIVSFAAGGVAAGAGIVLLLWPSAPANVRVSALPGGGRIGYEASF